MAKKGQSKHLKRYAASSALKLPRKPYPWVVKPAPGPHSGENSAPLRILLRDYLSLAKTAREADEILASGHAIVDGRVRRESRFPVGLMDVLQLPGLNRSYRVLLDHRGRLVPREIDQAEASIKLCKVLRKDIISGKRVQVTLHDGKTVVGDFGDLRPGDSVKLTLPDLRVIERLPFERGAVALVTRGENVGKIGKLIDIKLITGTQPDIVTLEGGGRTFQAPGSHVFIVGREKPAISLDATQAASPLNNTEAF